MTSSYTNDNVKFTLKLKLMFTKNKYNWFIFLSVSKLKFQELNEKYDVIVDSPLSKLGLLWREINSFSNFLELEVF